jgi:hypothetical protein
MTTPGMQGEVSPESMRETGLQPSKARPTRNRPLPQLLGDTAEQSRLKPCRGKPFELPNELELESQKGNPGYIRRTRRWIWLMSWVIVSSSRAPCGCPSISRHRP